MGQRDRVIEKLADRVDGIGDRVDGIGDRVDGIGDRVDGIGDRVERIAEQLDRTAEKLDRTAELLDRTAEQQDRVVQKLVELDDYVRTEVATKKELTSVKDELLLHVDGQAKKHETFDQEMAVLRYRMDTIEKK